MVQHSQRRSPVRKSKACNNQIWFSTADYELFWGGQELIHQIWFISADDLLERAINCLLPIINLGTANNELLSQKVNS